MDVILHRRTLNSCVEAACKAVTPKLPVAYMPTAPSASSTSVETKTEKPPEAQKDRNLGGQAPCVPLLHRGQD